LKPLKVKVIFMLGLNNLI